MSETRACSPRVHALWTRGITGPCLKARVQEERTVALTGMVVDRDPARAGIAESRSAVTMGKNRSR